MDTAKRKLIVIPADMFSALKEVAQEDGHNNTSVTIRAAMKNYLHQRGYTDIDDVVPMGNPEKLGLRDG